MLKLFNYLNKKNPLHKDEFGLNSFLFADFLLLYHNYNYFNYYEREPFVKKQKKVAKKNNKFGLKRAPINP